MNNSSLKKALILGMATAPTIETFQNNSLILLTAAGTISGTMLQNEDLKTLADTDPNSAAAIAVATIARGSQKAFKKQEGSEHDVTGNDGYLILKDVTVTNFSGVTTRMGALVVFFDQIIGATLGTI